MIKDTFSIKNWEITILYEITCNDIDYVIEILKEINCPNRFIKEALDNLLECQLNSGFIYSNVTLKNSVIVIGKTSSFSQLINTISHEYYHLICHISKVLNIKDEEELADLNGNLNMHSYSIVKKLQESRF